MYEDIIHKLGQKGVEFEIGLSEEELCWITYEYEITLSEGIKKFYKEALPISKGFYNWRDKSNENVVAIKSVMRSPIQWIVENSEEIDWNEKWGEEPSDSGERKQRIENMALRAPKLIPIYSHRYMASIRCNQAPVFSVYGADIICFAKDIIDYFLIEFRIKEHNVFKNNEVSYIPFWSDLL